MSRLILARALGIFLIALGLSILWNGTQELRAASSIGGYGVLVLQFVGGPVTVYAGYRLWRRDRSALRLIAVALTIATAAGALASWTYSGEERSTAAFGAVAAGVVFTIAMVLLARMSLAPEREV